MEMAIMRTFAILAVVLVMAQLAMGVDHSVGGPNGSWDLSTNMQQWASSQSFSVGDKLIFQYTSIHSVLEVTKANYDSCQIGNPLQSHTGGNTVIPLTSPGKQYFICGTAGHCSQGMKLEIDTVAASALPPAGAPPPDTFGPSASPPASPITPPPSTPSPSTPPPTSPIVPPSKSPSPSPEVPPSKSPSPSPKHSPSHSSKHSPSKSPSHSPKADSPFKSPSAAPLKSPSRLHSPSSSPSTSHPPTGSAPASSHSAANGGGVGAKAATGFGFGMVVMMILAL